MKLRRILSLFGCSSILVACAAGVDTGTDEGGGGSAGGGNTPSSGGTGGEPTGMGGGFSTNSSSATGVMSCPGDCLNVLTGPCEEAFCNTDTYTCEKRPVTDDTPCEDGLFCTDGDKCVAGVCEPGGPRDCGTSGQCGTASCDDESDECKFTPLNNGTACTPTDLCTDPALSICQAGQCVGAPKDCSATAVTTPECQAAACDAETGDCVVTPINIGIPCTFGDICHANKTCSAAGVCEGTPILGCTSCTESEPNNTAATANSGVGCAAWAGAITVINDKDCFLVEVPTAGSRISAEMVDVSGVDCPSGFDAFMRLFKHQGGTTWTEVATDDDDGNGLCPMFLPSDSGTLNLTAGDYAVCVEELGNNATSPPYLVLVSVAAPGCGNGIKEGTEECDDGNLIDGDSCSSTCQSTIYECAPGDIKLTFPATGLPLPILDLQTTNSPVSVPDVGTVTKVVVDVDITHGYCGDIDMSLIPPNAPPTILSNDNGSSGDNFTGTVFIEGGASIVSGVAPFTGLYAPQGGFGAIIGTQSAGTWTLSVTDDESIIEGMLDSWTLHLCITP